MQASCSLPDHGGVNVIAVLLFIYALIATLQCCSGEGNEGSDDDECDESTTMYS
jgi:hypothetical protein